MFSLIRVLVERLKSLFFSHAMVELEADLITLGARRQAALLRQADQFEKDGMPGIAVRIREQAAMLSIDKPLASVKAALTHLADRAESIKLADLAGFAAPAQVDAPSDPAPPLPRKKKPRPNSATH